MTPWTVEQWAVRLDELSRRHYKDPVTIEVVGPNVGDQIQVRRAALEGISLDHRQAPGGTVLIQVAAMCGAQTERCIEAPVKVQLKQTELGEDEVLAVEAADGTTTLVHFEGSLARLEPACSRATF